MIRGALALTGLASLMAGAVVAEGPDPTALHPGPLATFGLLIVAIVANAAGVAWLSARRDRRAS